MSDTAPRIVSVSTAPWDGWEPERTLGSLAACGATHVEPAFIVGYTEPFDEDAFTPDAARRYAAHLRTAGLRCHAMSSHIDLGRPDAVSVFRARMDFARSLGAAVINTNAAVENNADAFFRNIDPLIRHAEALDLVIGLENPGDARPNLVDSAIANGIALVRRLDTPRVRLNHDAANLASHRPSLDAVADAIAALPWCAHLHLKAARRTEDGFRHDPLDANDPDLSRLLDALRADPALPVAIELPLRMRHGLDAQPWRRVTRLPLGEIEAAVRRSLEAVRRI